VVINLYVFVSGVDLVLPLFFFWRLNYFAEKVKTQITQVGLKFGSVLARKLSRIIFCDHMLLRICGLLPLSRKFSRFYSRPGLLKFVDQAEQRRGSIDRSFYAKIVKSARSAQEIRDLIEDAEKKVGLDLALLSSAAFKASGMELHDRSSTLSLDLLKRIPEKDRHLIHPGVLGRVLGTAAAQKSFDDAMAAYHMLPVPSRTAFTLSRLIYAGLDPPEAKVKIQELILSTPIPAPPPLDLDVRTVGCFLKIAVICNDVKLGRLIWSWSRISRKTPQKCSPHMITIQFLQLLLSNEEFNEAITLVREEICSPPHPETNVVLVGTFLKIASHFNDIDLGKSIWDWSQQIRRTFQEPQLSGVTISFLLLCGTSQALDQAKVLIQKLIQSPPLPGDTSLQLVGAMLKVASFCTDIELVDQIWIWSEQARKTLEKSQRQHLCLITIQYLILCGKSGSRDLCMKAWNEAVASGVNTDSAVVSAMLRVLSFFATGESDQFISAILPSALSAPMVVSILSSYSHQGRAKEAEDFLQRIRGTTKDLVTLHAYTALIDSYARSGEFLSAFRIIEECKKDGFVPDVITWFAVLGPCRQYGDLSSALKAFQELKKCDPSDSDLATAHVLMSDVHRACGDEASALAMHDERLKKGLFKIPGIVTISVHGVTYRFHVDEIPQQLESYRERIEAKLEEWKRFVTSQGGSTESINCRHSEKLALAYGVIMGLKQITLEKNLRICSSCHAASILITLYEGIIIRHWDMSKRVHIMEHGSCSCGGRY
jgi:pentatricopeptide repeat protein